VVVLPHFFARERREGSRDDSSSLSACFVVTLLNTLVRVVRTVHTIHRLVVHRLPVPNLVIFGLAAVDCGLSSSSPSTTIFLSKLPHPPAFADFSFICDASYIL
jgi:hypothetical protein